MDCGFDLRTKRLIEGAPTPVPAARPRKRRPARAEDGDESRLSLLPSVTWRETLSAPLDAESVIRPAAYLAGVSSLVMTAVAVVGLLWMYLVVTLIFRPLMEGSTYHQGQVTFARNVTILPPLLLVLTAYVVLLSFAVQMWMANASEAATGMVWFPDGAVSNGLYCLATGVIQALLALTVVGLPLALFYFPMAVTGGAVIRFRTLNPRLILRWVCGSYFPALLCHFLAAACAFGPLLILLGLAAALVLLSGRQPAHISEMAPTIGDASFLRFALSAVMIGLGTGVTTFLLWFPMLWYITATSRMFAFLARRRGDDRPLFAERLP